MLGTFDIVRPASVEEASILLQTHGPDAAIYAGGTELLVLMKERLVHHDLLVDVKAIPGLAGIALDAGGRTLQIGALATHRAIERSPLVRERLPVLADLAANVANVRVRSAGTLGGNLCFAEPHSDPAALLVACGAVFTLTSATGHREVPAGGFFTGLLETVREPAEVMTEIAVPLPTPGTGIAYERFKTHERPSAAVAAALRLDNGAIADAAVVVGSVGERPARMREAESILLGKRPDPDLVVAAADRVATEVEPTEDAFESTDYKRHLARVLAARALASAIDRASQSGVGTPDDR